MVQDDQVHDAIQAALMELQHDYRVAIVLRHFSECSYSEMAEILDIPEKTVKSRLYSARQVLREKLCQRGVTTA
jgi:RNA polymerase sigma-70 factor (ECF subfamily)